MEYISKNLKDVNDHPIFITYIPNEDDYYKDFEHLEYF